MLDKKTVLKQYFGHSSFRFGQEMVVDAILQRRDALCVMPTGAGKSICYQVPALIFDGATLVVSPLISLMKDQVNSLTQNGIRAAYLNSSLTPVQYNKVISNIKNGIYKIIYVAPERLAVPDFLDACRSLKVDLVAVDEAHCISHWGQDFRPSYLKIAEFVNALGYRPVIAAFTATATAEVKDDIEYSLKLKSPLRMTTGFNRPNLKFEVLRPKKKFEQLLEILNNHTKDSGIIYADAIIAVEWNKDTNYYSNIVESLSRDLHCFCIQVNTSEFGDSRITIPSKTETKDLLKVKGGKNSTILLDTIDIAGLRNFQLKGHALQEKSPDGKKYKPTPPDFNYDVVSQKIHNSLWDDIE